MQCTDFLEDNICSMDFATEFILGLQEPLEDLAQQEQLVLLDPRVQLDLLERLAGPGRLVQQV